MVERMAVGDKATLNTMIPSAASDGRSCTNLPLREQRWVNVLNLVAVIIQSHSSQKQTHWGPKYLRVGLRRAW